MPCSTRAAGASNINADSCAPPRSKARGNHETLRLSRRSENGARSRTLLRRSAPTSRAPGDLGWPMKRTHLRSGSRREEPATRSDRRLKQLDEKHASPLVGEGTPARAGLKREEDVHAPTPGGAASWRWDLSTGAVEWDERLHVLFGYSERVTDAPWRESRIHPDDRTRVTTSLQRATIVNHGAEWSDQYRFRQADGSYAAVTERARVVQDDAGPRQVLGAIAPASMGRPTPCRVSPRTHPSGLAAHGRPNR